MVPIPRLSLIDAEPVQTIVLRLTLNVSVGSLMASFIMLTLIVLVVPFILFAGNVTKPLAVTKSLPAKAVPFDVA